jgi:hypothetical protein
LPHFWITATLGGVAALCAGAYLWEQQLPRKLSRALSTDDLPACLRYGEQLAALRWLGQKAPEELAVCRRRLAQQTWDQDDPGQALLLQEQLVNSGVGSLEQKEKDQEQLKLWRDELREQALSEFRAGNLDEALIMLRPLEKHDGRPGSRLSSSLKENWNRNRLQLETLREHVNQDQWWEALSALNQLDHPWWKRQAEPMRQKVEEAINVLRDQKEHHSHGALPTHTVARDLLNDAVEAHIREGMAPWEAFMAGCSDLGGTIVEDGPETLCQAKS